MPNKEARTSYHRHSVERVLEAADFEQQLGRILTPGELFVLRFRTRYAATRQEVAQIVGSTIQDLIKLETVLLGKLQQHQLTPYQALGNVTGFNFQAPETFNRLSRLNIDSQYFPGIRLKDYVQLMGSDSNESFEVANKVLDAFEAGFLDWDRGIAVCRYLFGTSQTGTEALLDLNILPFLGERQQSLVVSPAWLAGMWESGGTTTFNRTRNIPLVKLGDSRPSFLDQFQTLTGHGSIQGSEYKYWTTSRNAAVCLVTHMGNWAPSLARHRQYFEAWTDAQNLAQKKYITDAFFEHDGAERETSDYSSLIEKPEFLAGVIDLRGTLDIRQPEQLTSLRVTSANRSLIQAFEGRWGGKAEYDPRTNSNYWRTSGRKADQILGEVQPFLRYQTRAV